MDPVTLGVLAVGLAAAGAGTSVMAARSQNKAIEQQMDAQAKAAGIQQQQLTQQAAVEQTQREREADAIRGRIRVANAESGFGTGGGTFGALMQQADFDEAFNLQILDNNLSNNLAAVKTGADANLASLESKTQNVLLQGITGAIGGASTGLSLGQGINNIMKPKAIE